MSRAKHSVYRTTIGRASGRTLARTGWCQRDFAMCRAHTESKPFAESKDVEASFVILACSSRVAAQLPPAARRFARCRLDF